MIEEITKLEQARHHLEESEARNRTKERRERTRRLIQEGAILEKVFSWAATTGLSELEGKLYELSHRQ